MKACFVLLHYLTTWMAPVRWLLWLGLALALAMAVMGIAHQGNVAFGLAIYSFVFLLALPYLFAWHAFRTILGSRRLALLPHFRLQLGLALLLLTVLLALYLPLASLWFAPGVIPLRVALAVFLGATLFTFAMQWAVASPYSVVIYSLGPFVLVYLLAKAAPLLFLTFNREENVPALLLVATLAWVFALRVLVSRRSFAPPRKAPLHFRDYVWEGRSDVFGILFGNYKGAVKSAAGTLLLGAPDGFAGRFFIMLNMVALSPLMGMAAMYLAGFGPANLAPGTLAPMFMTFSLTTTLIFGFGNGEHASRYRLLWLRVGGDRAGHWRRLERRVFADTGMLALIVVPLTGVILMLFDTVSFDPFTYGAVALAGHLLCNYFSLAARLRQWSLLLQLVTAAATTAGFVIGGVFAILPLPVLIALMLGLALLFRQQARQSFATVDWHQLRPALQTPRGKLA